MAKQKDVKVGQVWIVTVSGIKRRCRVDKTIRPEQRFNWRTGQKKRRERLQVYLTNLATGNKIQRSAAALLREVTETDG
jgi:hypothetical protein